jgi:protein TonB
MTMSYVDGNSGTTNRKALTGGVVALIQGGIALALINGLAVNFFPPDKPRNLASEFFPTKPIPTETIEPKDQPDQAIARDSHVDAPQPKLPLVSEPTFTDVVIDPLPSGAGVDTRADVVRPFAIPSDPPARFTPRSAKPRGDQARWVTTEDYPTTDVRAGHTGTVRFRLALDASGKVADCTITRSSGYPGLDAATCRNVTKRARFDAASDGAGEKVAGSYDGTIRWVIPQD